VTDVGSSSSAWRSPWASSGSSSRCLPGALLVWAAIAAWALPVGSATAWAVLGLATLLIGGAQVVKLLVPGRRLCDAGVTRGSIVAGLTLAVAGFFLIPWLAS
jgi:hypothetical protein